MIYRGKQKAWIAAVAGLLVPLIVHVLQRLTDMEIDADRTAELAEAVITGLVTGAGAGTAVYAKANKDA